ncbi:MAG: ABC transporter ATP-binding protein, partial [Candidatus Binatia bacterium]
SQLVLPLIPIVVRLFGSQIFRWSRDVQEQLSGLSAYVQENLSGVRVVQAYAQEESRVDGFTAVSSDFMRKNLRLATLWGIFWPLMRVLAGIAAAVVLWLGGRKVLEGTMTLGEFVAFNGYLGMLTWPLMAVGHVVNQYQRGTAALSRIIEVLDTPVAPPYRQETPDSPVAIRGAIEFRSLSFGYGDNGFALKNISLAIPAGTSCGIVGETGSGKSTLVNLLPRLFEPPDGTVFIDGVDIKKFPRRVLREMVGFVSQDIFLFSGTVRENILFGRKEGESEDGQALEASAQKAQLLPTLRQFARGFDTMVGERGVRFSGGQRQRTALARAIVKDPAILVLDDAFSSVDTETEEAILRGVAGFIRKRTTLLISHRISTVQRADWIVYLRAGEIIEQGTHEDLLARKGAYYHLYQRQKLVREVEEAKRTEYTGQRAMHDLRIEIFSHLQKQDLVYFDHNPVGRLLTRTVHDVETLNELFSTGVIGLLGDVCIVFGIAGAMLFLDWKLALVTLAAFPIILYVSGFYRRRARQVYRESRLILARMNATLQENIAGIATIQAFGQEEKAYGKFHGINTDYRNLLLRSIRYNALFFPVIEIFSASTIGLALWYRGSLIQEGALGAGVLVAFIQYIQRMYHPIRDLAEKYNIMQAAMASSERIFSLLDAQPVIKNPMTPRRPLQLQGAVEFNDVWLSYSPGEAVLRGISFTVRPGEKVALVGATGAGKTSIISALCRFYEIDRGKILVDGVDIRKWNKQELRRHLGLVLQDSHLFDE